MLEGDFGAWNAIINVATIFGLFAVIFIVCEIGKRKGEPFFSEQRREE